jgi:hypothetical protein
MANRIQEATMAPEVTIRQATSTDAFALRRLAALDDRAALHGEVLVAEQAGEIRAALSIEDGRAVANPFAPTARLVDMLRVHRGFVATLAA